MTFRRFATLGFVLLAVCWMALPVSGQTAGTGALSITIIDPSGAVIPGAAVNIVNTATGISRSQTSAENGTAQFAMLPPGSYNVSISATGFKRVDIPSVIVNVAETHTLNQRLDLGATQEQITVESGVEAVQA